MMKEAETLVGVAEAARLAGKHPNTIYRWVQDGTLVPTLRLKGRTGAILLNVEDVRKAAADSDAQAVTK